MKVELWVVGKTAFTYLKDGIAIYEKRLKHYLSFQIVVIPDIKKVKNLKAALVKQREGEVILKNIQKEDLLILLDENGKALSSKEFAGFIENQQISAQKKLVFLIGGAFGFSKAVYERANRKISLSKMTLSHQMVRLFFVEQLYRAMTIIKGESYHNE